MDNNHYRLNVDVYCIVSQGQTYLLEKCQNIASVLWEVKNMVGQVYFQKTLQNSHRMIL